MRPGEQHLPAENHRRQSRRFLIFGYSVEEMSGCPITFLHLDETHFMEPRKELLKRLDEAGHRYVPEFKMKRSNGEVFYSGPSSPAVLLGMPDSPHCVRRASSLSSFTGNNKQSTASGRNFGLPRKACR